MQDLDAWPVLRECKSNPELRILTHLHCPGLAQNHLGTKTHLFDQTACAVQVNGKTIALKKKHIQKLYKYYAYIFKYIWKIRVTVFPEV